MIVAASSRSAGQQTAPTSVPALALTSQTVSWLAPEMLKCGEAGSHYGCLRASEFIAARRYQVLKCVYGGTFYLFWKDQTPPRWDEFTGNAFQYFGRSVLTQCPADTTENRRTFY